MLPNGKVLLVGGIRWNGTTPRASLVDLFDPATGSFTPTGSLATARDGHTATLLDSGKVLVTGGYGTSVLASSELYDPATGSFEPTGPMLIPRQSAVATLLRSGKVLISGGWPSSSSAELYDPVTGSFTATGSLTTARYRHTATRLDSGKVLIAGGSSSSSAELYDPATGIFTATGSMVTARESLSSTLLPDGKVLLAGGRNFNDTDYAYTLTSSELYDPTTETFTPTGSMTNGRARQTATRLPDGTVLIAGGVMGTYYGAWTETTMLATTELYDPATGSFTTSVPLAKARSGHTATLLGNGQVLVFNDPSNFELYRNPVNLPLQICPALSTSYELGRPTR